MRTHICHNRGGFSLVEVLVAMLVLTVGILAVAATTGHIFNRLNDAGRRTERAFAAQQVIEGLRSVPFADVDQSMDTTVVVGAFTVRARVEAKTTRIIRVQVETSGPGHRPGVGQVVELKDTTYVSISRGGS